MRFPKHTLHSSSITHKSPPLPLSLDLLTATALLTTVSTAAALTTLATTTMPASLAATHAAATALALAVTASQDLLHYPRRGCSILLNAQHRTLNCPL